MIPEHEQIKGGPDAQHTYEPSAGKPFSPLSGYAAYLTDLTIIRDKLHSLRQPLLGKSDAIALLVESALWSAQIKVENAIRYAA